ncbi:hypothetical protein AM501_05355 [Aneurinibacillus migulanus]|uniref:hypothetical protein n=1 Tax=Aneurinibacillus migulanus TaxID=47500 RepID=UPI0005BD6AFD|nr:hypothetical protein [Aneurinibacillus migulanus]KIV58566.1 hypothetical protein TS64_04260 [Aneurinibacillus migulanus]KPD09262.1 hypothetical protein AM501_05355 [Aneurinibacillus migulanus]
MRIQDLTSYSIYRGLNNLQKECLREEILQHPNASKNELISNAIKKAAERSKQQVRKRRRKIFSNIIHGVGTVGVMIMFFIIFIILSSME